MTTGPYMFDSTGEALRSFALREMRNEAAVAADQLAVMYGKLAKASLEMADHDGPCRLRLTTATAALGHVTNAMNELTLLTNMLGGDLAEEEANV